MQPSLQDFAPPNPPIVWGEKYCLQDNYSPKDQRRGCKILRESLSCVTPAKKYYFISVPKWRQILDPYPIIHNTVNLNIAGQLIKMSHTQVKYLI